MSESPTVSVIIPTYNRAALLPRAVDSVLAQTYQDFELLIVDDCSTDDTPAVIAGFADPRLRAIRHEQNRRQTGALNTGLAEARGEFAAFLDDDDEFTPDSLAERMALMEASPPETALVYGWADRIDDAIGRVIEGRRTVVEGDGAFEYALRAQNITATSTFLVRTAAAREIGGFDGRLTAANDSFFVCNILSKYRIAVLRKVIVRYHENHGGARMTDPDDARRRDVDRYYQLHMEQFSAELALRPKTRASIMRARAMLAMECGHVIESLRWSVDAFKLHLLTPANLRHLLRLARVFIFYTTPASRYRERAKAVRQGLRQRKE